MAGRRIKTYNMGREDLLSKILVALAVGELTKKQPDVSGYIRPQPDCWSKPILSQRS